MAKGKPSELYVWALAFMQLLNIATGWLCCVLVVLGEASDWKI